MLNTQKKEKDRDCKKGKKREKAASIEVTNQSVFFN